MRIALISMLFFSSLSLAGYVEYRPLSIQVDSRGLTEKVHEVTELDFQIIWLN